MWRWVNPEKQRYYLADLVEDLFGDWTLIKAWGNLDSKQGRQSITGVTDYEDGLRKIVELNTYRKKRGYVAASCSSPTTTTGDSQFGKQ